ncbi:hypothetical protein H9Q74_001920 [Fusarium xylarioides]|nr:hypothetical protein H9Q73_000765 [Fusarium xylarioides]KAG5827988.1 hypothetical protein H9Q74_001920 [Fusarium xylarioides]
MVPRGYLIYLEELPKARRRGEIEREIVVLQEKAQQKLYQGLNGMMRSNYKYKISRLEKIDAQQTRTEDPVREFLAEDYKGDETAVIDLTGCDEEEEGSLFVAEGRLMLVTAFRSCEAQAQHRTRPLTHDRAPTPQDVSRDLYIYASMPVTKHCRQRARFDGIDVDNETITRRFNLVYKPPQQRPLGSQPRWTSQPRCLARLRNHRNPLESHTMEHTRTAPINFRRTYAQLISINGPDGLYRAILPGLAFMQWCPRIYATAFQSYQASRRDPVVEVCRGLSQATYSATW